MTLGYSSCDLIGRLAQDPQFFNLDSDKACVTFSLAVNNKRKDRDDVSYINVVGFRKLVTLFKQLEIKKGDPLFVNGSVQTSYEDKEGNKKTTFSIILNDFTLLRSKVDTKVA